MHSDIDSGTEYIIQMYCFMVMTLTLVGLEPIDNDECIIPISKNSFGLRMLEVLPSPRYKM
jgi:uncharacterized spore protein YtfJ